MIISIIFLSCTQKEVAPFKDGLYLEYKVNIYGPMGDFENFLRISFRKTDDQNFRVEISSSSSRTEEFIELDEPTELLVSRFGKMQNGKYFKIGALGELWIPPSEFHKGEKISDGAVLESIKWAKWHVWVLSRSIAGARMNWYYEKNTGFLVGSNTRHMGSGMNAILVETNLAGI